MADEPPPFNGTLVPVVEGSSYVRPTIGRVVILPDIDGMPPLSLPLIDYRVEAHIHISVAFVTVTARYRNAAPRPAPCVLELPISQRVTVTNVDIILDNGKAFASTVVDAGDTKGVKEDEELSGALAHYFSVVGANYRTASYDPDIFRVPFAPPPAGSVVTVRAQYFQNLDFVRGSYVLHVPMRVPPGTLEGPGIGERITSFCHINTGTEESKWEGTTHAMDVVEGEGSRVVLASRKGPGAQPNADFVISYKAWSPQVLCNLQVQPTPDNRAGSFTIFLSPPQADTITASFSRRIVFIIDNSGSMTGRPMENAKEALVSAIGLLQPADLFAICVFNHEQEWWMPGGGGAGAGYGTHD